MRIAEGPCDERHHHLSMENNQIANNHLNPTLQRMQIITGTLKTVTVLLRMEQCR